MKHLSNDREECLNHHENVHKLCNETGHPVMNLMENHWKLRQQDDYNLPMEGKPL